MASEVRLLQQTDARDPAGIRKLMPACLFERMERAGFHDGVEGALERMLIRERTGVATLRVYHPLDPTHSPPLTLLLCRSALAAELCRARNLTPTNHAELQRSGGRRACA